MSLPSLRRLETATTEQMVSKKPDVGAPMISKENKRFEKELAKKKEKQDGLLGEQSEIIIASMISIEKSIKSNL